MKYIIIAMFALIFSLTLGTPARADSASDLYDRKCGRCHQVIAPESHPSEAWPGIIRSMRSEAALSPTEERTLTEYLTTAGAGERAGSGPEQPRIGGYLYTEYFQSPQETENFDLHYLAVHVTGWAGEKIAYHGEFELEHGGKGDNTFVEQAYLDYWLLPNLGLRIGAMLAPFNRFDERHDPLGNHLISRPQMSREIGVSAWKEVGVNLHGHLKLADQASLHFDLYTVNGMGAGANLRGSRQYRDNNEDKAVGARGSLVLSDVVELGASFYGGAWDDAGEHDLTLLGAHGRLKTAIADLLVEYARADSENPAPSADGEMSGYFVEVTRLLAERFRTTLRYGGLDYLDPGESLGRDPAKGDKELTELAFGLAYYPTPGVAFKFEYTIFDEGDRMETVDNDRLGLQAAVDF